MNNQEEMLFLKSVVDMCYLAHKYLKEKSQKRRWWVRPLYQQRQNKGFYETTFKAMKENDPDLFLQNTRMNVMQYRLLLSLVTKSLTKTSIRKPIDPECRLVLTLMYLSQGVSPSYLALSFRMGVSTVRQIILEVCQVLWNVLSSVYMPELKPGDWNLISNQFNKQWNLPNCLGSIDGKHVRIKCPPNSGSKYLNYKGYHSIALLGICDASYIFTAVDVAADGNENEAGIFRNSCVGKKIFDNDPNIPQVKILPNSERRAPYYFVADSAYPLRKNLMRPYPVTDLNKPEEVFNFRLSRGLSVIENAFGILTTRWRVLGKCIDFHPKNTSKIVLACVILHNFLLITDSVYKSDSYCPKNYCDTFDKNGKRIDGLWRLEKYDLLPIRKCGSNNWAHEASSIRKILSNYFFNEGKVPFQPQ